MNYDELNIENDIDIYFDLNNHHDFEYLKDHEDLGIIMNINLRIEIDDLLNNIENLLYMKNKENSIILNNQLI